LNPTKKTLYIHGLDSSPKQDKIKIVEKYSKAFSLHLNYHNEPNSFNILSNLIIEKNINFIIGSSFGGMLGYWLAEKHKIPALLFNPALQIEKSIIHFEINHNKSPFKLIILGMKDEIVDPIITSKFLNKNLHDKNYEIINCDELAHKIDMETFKKQTDYFFKKLEN
jgi:hypothetical protein